MIFESKRKLNIDFRYKTQRIIAEKMVLNVDINLDSDL